MFKIVKTTYFKAENAFYNVSILIYDVIDNNLIHKYSAIT